MPELPEVEVVRRGLHEHLVGRAFGEVRVLHPRAVRRHTGGPADLEGQLRGATVAAARRRGKFLWLPLTHSDGAAPDSAIVVHLGMSGQVLVNDGAGPTDDRHLRIRAELAGGGVLRFVDQRTFGGWAIDPLVGGVAAPGSVVPASVAHIARDPLEDGFDVAAVVRRLKSKDSEIKRLLLDQTVVSGIGNIYADEALWRAGMHGRRRASELTKPALARVLGHAADVMREALDQGGTSFDALYVNVNGDSGTSQADLNVYGRQGQPCKRCGTPIVRERFMNRSSHFCRSCQGKR